MHETIKQIAAWSVVLALGVLALPFAIVIGATWMGYRVVRWAFSQIEVERP